MKKYSKFLVVFLMIALLLTGCNSQNFSKPEQISEAVKQIVDNTEKAINDKDLKLARLLWSQISRYGVKAGEAGHKELGEELGRLASTYVNLVQYLETGDENQLTIFRKNFTKAITVLQKRAIKAIE